MAITSSRSHAAKDILPPVTSGSLMRSAGGWAGALAGSRGGSRLPYLPEDQRFLISCDSIALFLQHSYQFETKLPHKCSWDQSTDLKYGKKEVFLWAICWRDFVL